MKKIYSTCVGLFILLGCSSNTPYQKLSGLEKTTEPPKPITDVDNSSIMKQLLKFKKATQRAKLYAKSKIKIFPEEAYSELYKTLGNSPKKATIYLKGERTLMLLVDLFNMDKNIHTNIVPSKLTLHGEYMGIEINIDNIKNNNVTIYDKNNNILYEYKIIR